MRSIKPKLGNKHMKKILFVLSIFLIFAFTKSDAGIQNTKVSILPESTLVVNGTTNVNSFQCVFNTQKLKNPVSVSYVLASGKLKFKETALVLDNYCFDCGGKGINRDFQSILQTNHYPQIRLILKEITELNRNNKVQTLVDVEIAGVKNEYLIPVKIKKEAHTIIEGSLNLNLSDYKLTAPKKMFGLIAVDDEIAIDFSLVVQ